ncbi:zinc transporter, ZIP family [Chishuiella changwenlii]|uniref:Zinc transporter ZupT n=1 Tax=Chishuiella changwenlii TaxID=1434701 RepID=A0A1M6SX38_9FLAO|nr:zinc transporter ZupT [Chishuiella changwenlii]GGF09005.1 zinc transporter ZupT [Chishuiella changwenlii]SHK49254.1 zinc transporter, ZIP family [Chishuiella changwenlii]
MLSDSIVFAFSLTFLAGISTGIGAILSLLYKKFNPKFLGIMLGVSAGVMLYVSFVEILLKAKTSLSINFGEKASYTYSVLGFFVGIFIIMLIEKLIPHQHESDEIIDDKESSDKKLLRLGLFSALALSIHNFPEGLATFLTALEDPTYGISIAVAIAIHNIPEGIAVAIPIYYATKSRKKAFWYSFLSGLTEPIGALIGYFFLLRFIDQSIFGIIFAGVAGMMVYISINELIPTAKEYAGKKLSTLGIVFGMLIMAISLILFL